MLMPGEAICQIHQGTAVFGLLSEDSLVHASEGYCSAPISEAENKRTSECFSPNVCPL